VSKIILKVNPTKLVFWQRRLRDEKINFRLFSHSFTNPEHFAKISPVGVDIIGLKLIDVLLL